MVSRNWLTENNLDVTSIRKIFVTFARENFADIDLAALSFFMKHSQAVLLSRYAHFRDDVDNTNVQLLYVEKMREILQSASE